ncbi:sigma-70 family RNA polymerase sigma factor [Georgenia yuyongxinii]|uniref:Sigma-70 family RNA polymerase sigma factor n=1 Tax=Georgenia yuyongxinii TaxID=2589797 RepID=A0A5B8C3G1_9MICO|nr:sigma-70 family RNA polymerase sigma factor [Georgenia yuyongxinii]
MWRRPGQPPREDPSVVRADDAAGLRSAATPVDEDASADGSAASGSAASAPAAPVPAPAAHVTRATSIPSAGAAVPGGVHLYSRTDRAADAALAAGLALDDEQAAAAFVRRFQGPVYGLALSITRDPALAEDVSQEVFIRAWRAAASYDVRRASVLTWLLTITRNAAIDAVRMRRAIPTEGEELEQILAETMRPPETEATALRNLERELAVQHLRELPPEQARAVVLAVIGGCTALEVSRHEGIPLGTAKTRIRTGLRRVRQQLKEVHRD